MARTQVEIYEALAQDATKKRDWPAVERHYRAIGDLYEEEEKQADATPDA